MPTSSKISNAVAVEVTDAVAVEAKWEGYEWLGVKLFIHHETEELLRQVGLTHQLGAHSTDDVNGTGEEFSSIVEPCVQVRVRLPGGDVVAV